MSRNRNCYSRNGTLITDIAYKPCNSDPARDSFCCGTNHQGAGHTLVEDDVCESNGLCQNYEPYDGTNEGAKLWWRQGCTDQTWESKECLKNVCNYGTWQDDNGFAPVRNCGGNNWCCGEKECCLVTSSLFTLAATFGATETSSSARESTSTSESASTSLETSSSNNNLDSPTITSTNNPNPTSPSSTAAPAPAPSAGLSTPVRAGIGAGAAIVFLLLLLIAFLLFKLKKKRRHGRERAIDLSGDSVHEKDTSDRYAHLVAHPVELQGGSRPHELDSKGSSRPQELDSSRREVGITWADVGMRGDVMTRDEEGIREDVRVRQARGMDPVMDPRYAKGIALP